MIIVVFNREVNDGATDHSVFGDKPNPPKLGNTAEYLTAENAVYFDFTDGKYVETTHGVFYKTVKKNQVMKQIFQRALTGKRAERVRGITLNTSSNAYELDEKDETGSNEDWELAVD